MAAPSAKREPGEQKEQARNNKTGAPYKLSSHRKHEVSTMSIPASPVTLNMKDTRTHISSNYMILPYDCIHTYTHTYI